MDEKYNEVFTEGKPDKLNIGSYVVDFAHVIEQSSRESKVYAISAPFGIGKTFFCEKLKGVLEADSVPVAIMNIWKMDFYGHPLIPILLKLKEFYGEIVGEKAQSFPATPNLLRWIKSGIAGLRVSVPLPNGAIIEADGKNIVDTNEALKEKTNSEIDIYTEYIDIKSEIENIKVFLKSWAESFKDKPVVVIIDELDRCRPDYAVKTLEVLKHFFDIPGFVFILAIDEEQLKSSVETLFGTKNFDGYKRKFINNSFLLPAPDKVKFTNYLYEKSGLADIVKQIEANKQDLVFKTVVKNLELRHFNSDKSLKTEQTFNKNQTTENIIKRYFAAYSIWFQFSLRRMEQVFDRLVLFSKNILSSNELYSPDLAVLLVCLHEFDLKIYDKLRLSSFRVYGQHGGLLRHIYNTSRNDFSFARSVYADKADDMFGTLNRTLIPKVPEIQGFSTTEPTGQTYIVIIHDDVDRFFVAEESQKHPLAWIVEIQDFESGVRSMVQNNGRIAVVTNSKRDAAWKDGSADIDTASRFDLEQFKKNYFDKMDFISNFK